MSKVGCFACVATPDWHKLETKLADFFWTQAWARYRTNPREAGKGGGSGGYTNYVWRSWRNGEKKYEITKWSFPSPLKLLVKMSKKSQQKCPLCNDVLPEDQEIEDHVNLFHKGYTVHFILEAEICSLRMRFSRKSFHDKEWKFQQKWRKTV